jgi:hypothetical protein
MCTFNFNKLEDKFYCIVITMTVYYGRPNLNGKKFAASLQYIICFKSIATMVNYKVLIEINGCERSVVVVDRMVVGITTTYAISAYHH